MFILQSPHLPYQSLSPEPQLKATFPHEKAEEARQWIERIIEEKLEGDFITAIQDGSKLCKLLNKLQPGLLPAKFEKPTTLQMKKVSTCTVMMSAYQSYCLEDVGRSILCPLGDKAGRWY